MRCASRGTRKRLYNIRRAPPLVPGVPLPERLRGRYSAASCSMESRVSAAGEVAHGEVGSARHLVRNVLSSLYRRSPIGAVQLPLIDPTVLLGAWQAAFAVDRAATALVEAARHGEGGAEGGATL